jgi:HEAT repeat protein
VAALAAAGAAALAGCNGDPAGPVTDRERLVAAARSALRRAASDRRPATRSHAVEAMAEVWAERAGEFYEEALRDEQSLVRLSGALAVGDAGYSGAHERLGRMAAEKSVEPDRRVLCGVIYALHRLGDDRYTPALKELLFDDEPEVRAYAAMVMGKMGEPSAVVPLKTLLAQEQSPTVRVQVHESLARLGVGRSIVLLEGYTARGYFLDLRLAAIPALAKARSRNALRVFRHIVVHGRSPRARVAAAGAMTLLGVVDDEAYELCLAAAGKPRAMMAQAHDGGAVADAEVASLRELAAIALGRMGRPAAATVLEPLIDSPHGGVRVAAAMGILKLLETGGD